MHDYTDNNQKQQRGRPCGARPWCWQEKAVLKMIRDIFDSTRNVASALSIYLALTEIASDDQTDTFIRRITEIADRAGVSYRTAAKTLDRLEEVKIISIKRREIPGTKERLPSEYTLMGLGNCCASLVILRHIQLHGAHFHNHQRLLGED